MILEKMIYELDYCFGTKRVNGKNGRFGKNNGENKNHQNGKFGIRNGKLSATFSGKILQKRVRRKNERERGVRDMWSHNMVRDI